ncbi:MAG: N-acetylmuramoyl-L-alanine amidase [Chitinophagaceae bacterium]|jgi:N-acetylmuramoyl-L-alanine amidase|nr:N-acetylmuramoyl-L-alanine amidase [Chitinophagaceae bacterium]
MKFLVALILCLLFINDHLAAQQGLRWAESTGKLPYLEYGPGDDRLGGAKMTYLDSQVLLQVVDSLDRDYIIRLSANHKAFIPKENVRLKNDTRPAPAYRLSGNFRVYGDDRFDYVAIALPEKLPYRSQMQVGPSRILVDIFGVTSNTNWVTQLNTAREIRNTWYEQVEDDVLRVHIDLVHAQHWGYHIHYDSTGNRLLVRVKRQPTSMDIRKMSIAIDAGHGGANTGATGVSSGVLEKDYCLRIARELESHLRKSGARNIFMTRTTDTTLDMPDRILMLRQADPDLLVSIHLNSSGRDTVQGTSTYYRYIGFRPLSGHILKRMLELKLKEFGNVGHFNFALSGPTEYPNCLVEVAFLSNPEDEKKILDPRFQKSVARKITDGIRDWLKENK